jgi:hypothetical protein
LIDVLEMLKYLANMNSSISKDGIVYQAAFNAARVKGEDKPVIGDVLEMLKWLANMNSDYLTPIWGVKS